MAFAPKAMARPSTASRLNKLVSNVAGTNANVTNNFPYADFASAWVGAVIILALNRTSQRLHRRSLSLLEQKSLSWSSS